MLKKTAKFIITILQIIMLIAPFALVAYHLYNFLNFGNFNLIPLSSAFSNFLNLSITTEEVSENLEAINDIYISLVRLPLLLWLFVLSIPAFVGLYRKM